MPGALRSLLLGCRTITRYSVKFYKRILLSVCIRKVAALKELKWRSLQYAVCHAGSVFNFAGGACGRAHR
jgi:hypothetical protein